LIVFQKILIFPSKENFLTLVNLITPHNPENEAPSKKKQNAIIDNLSKACSNYVQTEMLSSLKEAFAA
jgi:hypothetical protein